VGFLGGAAVAQEGKIVLKRPGGPADPPPAVFPHWIHRIRFTCYTCHPGPIKPGATPITHDAMATGQFCGACHNGQVAWGISFATCNRCHVAQ
jgi:c(7)-type cytochrome triheme protein